MPRGPKGQKRPGDVIGAAVMVAKIATGEIEESEAPLSAAQELGRKGGAARAKSMTAKRRKEIAKKAAGQGENITTRGIDLLGLARGALLYIGEKAVVEITGLRNPCSQLDRVQPGLMAATRERSPEGRLIRKAGIMGIVITGGEVRPGDAIRVTQPPPPHKPLERV